MTAGLDNRYFREGMCSMNWSMCLMSERMSSSAAL